MSNNYINLSYKDGVRTIVLNRPERKNAICFSMYQTLLKVLTEDAKDEKIVLTIITGFGNYFSSGNDLKDGLVGDIPISERLNSVRNMIMAFINYPKLLIAVVNGPAIGIGATMAVLCDIVYASDQAVFDTPFVKIGLCAEGASSFTFPFILGRSKASEMLYLNKKIGAQEAFQFGLVSRVIPHAELPDFINDLYQYRNISRNALKINKKLVMANFKDVLVECVNREVEQLRECIHSDEFSNNVMQFYNKNSKL